VLLDNGAAAGAEGQVVVTPEHVRQYQVIPLVDEHVGNNGETVGKGIGDNGVAEVLIPLTRVFPQHFFPPECPQFRFAGRRSIGVDIFWIKGREFVLDALQEHRAAFFGGNTNGCVEFMSLLFGFSRLGQNSFGKEEVFAKVGKHFKGMRAVLGKQFVQFDSQWVHSFLLI